MKRSTNKKGFTIVELVIVIAVIAILAAVLIPTFSSLIKKANRSADIQAVRQMNTALAANEVTEGKAITEVHKALSESGLTSKDYRPLSSDTYFFWDKATNRILYTDDTYTVIYPEERKGDKFNEATDNWSTLSGEIKEEEPSVSEDGKTATITTGAQLYYISKHMTDITTIVIENDINLMGADVSFVVDGTTSLTEISGKEGGVTIKGLTSFGSYTTGKVGDPNANKSYSTGFVAKVSGKGFTIKNITLEGAEVGNLEVGGVGALIGTITAYNKTVTIKNCSVIESTVYGKNKVGGMVGYIGDKSTLNITSSKIDHVTVNCSEGQAGMAIGCVYSSGGESNHNNPAITVDSAFNSWVTNCKTNLVTGAYKRNTVEGTIKLNSTELKDIACLVEKLSDDGTNVEGYRMYAKDAYMCIQHRDENEKPSVKIADEEKSVYTTYGTEVTVNSDTKTVDYIQIIK